MSEKIRYDVRNFTNIDEEDFIGKWGGEEYLIKKGETRSFPEFLVKHFAKHLVNKILLRKGVKNYLEPSLRQPLEDKILGDVIIKAEPQGTKSEAEEIKEEVETVQKIVEEEFEGLKKKKGRKTSKKK